jgi:small subunit ribosomal protein S2
MKGKDMSNYEVDVKKLLEAGAHFGHKTSRWHPKMAPFIHSKRGDSHIIDLYKTAEKLEEALNFINKTVAEGKQILLVSTKRQAKTIIEELAEQTKMPHVTNRWLGGMLTNHGTMNVRIKHLVDLEKRSQTGELAAKYSKLEVQRFSEEIDAMNLIYGGIKEMDKRPGALFVVDILEDHNAVREAGKLGIPVVALVDTNTDPTPISYPIPCNDDAIKAIKLIADMINKAVTDGKNQLKKPTEAKKEEDK